MKKPTYLILLFLTVITTKLEAQNWLTAGNNVAGGMILGANAASTAPLQIRHNGALSIQQFTTNIARTKLNPTINYNVNNFAGARNGYFWLDLCI